MGVVRVELVERIRWQQTRLFSGSRRGQDRRNLTRTGEDPDFCFKAEFREICRELSYHKSFSSQEEEEPASRLFLLWSQVLSEKASGGVQCALFYHWASRFSRNMQGGKNCCQNWGKQISMFSIVEIVISKLVVV